ncbi:MAG: hypothetical protein ACRC62_10420, partial [Microcoleus sp.]
GYHPSCIACCIHCITSEGVTGCTFCVEIICHVVIVQVQVEDRWELGGISWRGFSVFAEIQA